MSMVSVTRAVPPSTRSALVAVPPLLPSFLTSGRVAISAAMDTMKNATIRPMRNGMNALTILSMLSPVMEEPTNRFSATGGVTNAMARASVMMMPKWMGSMPT